MKSLSEQVKTTDKDPLVTVHQGKSLHTHANLSVANSIHGAKVQAADVLKGPVRAGKYTFALSMHHETEKKKDAMKEEVEQVEEGILSKIFKSAAMKQAEKQAAADKHNADQIKALKKATRKSLKAGGPMPQVNVQEAARNWIVHTSTGKHSAYGPSDKDEMEKHLHRQYGGFGEKVFGKVHKMEPDDSPSGVTYSGGRRYHHGRQDSNEQVELSQENTMKEAMSHQARTTMKHIKNPTAGEKQAAKDIKPGIKGFRDRIDMLHSAKARGALKETAQTEDVVAEAEQKAPGMKVHPNALHVSDAGGGKYKVHAVGSKHASGIKVGEHLSDSELDDFSEMGGHIKMMKPKKESFFDDIQQGTYEFENGLTAELDQEQVMKVLSLVETYGPAARMRIAETCIKSPAHFYSFAAMMK